MRLKNLATPTWIIRAAAAGAIATAFASTALATEIGAYFPSWSADSSFRLKHLEQSGLTDQLSYLNYAFENIYPMPDGTYRCDNGSDLDDQGAGQGMHASLDYLRRFSAAESVDGSADDDEQALAGNFNQLRQLKQKHPQLKVLVALGGWTWSRWFSAASATSALRTTLVASCIDLYIKGNLPRVQGHGGAGAAAGVFDGFDLDWEHPGLPGIGYNVFSERDRQNFTLLLAEFRRQLDNLNQQPDAKNKRRYLLSAAINGSKENLPHTEPAQYARYLDWINLMTYDFHGAWDKHGPTSFQSNLYPDPGGPETSMPSIAGDVSRLLDAGVPAEKIVLGIPFYARGWSGVAPANNGLYQTAQGPAAAVEEGAESYARIAAKSLTRFYHPVTRQLWTYDQGTFWTFDDPVVIREKINYVRHNKLGGMMSWSLDQDDEQFSLTRAMLELRVK
ncbi:chitinase [Oxalobacteraceae bacterium GrIS 2.11]